MRYKSFDAMPLTLTVRDIADTLAIGRNMAYSLVNSGELHCLRIGNQIRIPRDSFISFVRRDTPTN